MTVLSGDFVPVLAAPIPRCLKASIKQTQVELLVEIFSDLSSSEHIALYLESDGKHENVREKMHKLVCSTTKEDAWDTLDSRQLQPHFQGSRGVSAHTHAIEHEVIVILFQPFETGFT